MYVFVEGASCMCVLSERSCICVWREWSCICLLSERS